MANKPCKRCGAASHRCEHCGSAAVYHIPTMPHTLDCRACHRTTCLVKLAAPQGPEVSRG